MKANTDKLIENALPLAIGAAVILGVVYFIVKKTLGAAVDTAAGALTGNNAITKNATNASGERVTAYEGAGILGTLGAATNAVSGGTLASLGEKISSWFEPGEKSENLYYRVLFPDGSFHAVGSLSIDKNGYFVWSGKRYRIGVNQGNQRVAVAA